MKEAFRDMYPSIKNNEIRKKKLVGNIMSYQCDIEEYVHNWKDQIKK